ncbi:MAG: hypothetical protein A3I02_03555 [Betaproteobacteria bacterium RIFCSPLOWO2_02_FULL_67_26]|nr:MAG: hypothetical protein A3I02_03555 [Betaproteobacteria bacterium RIFCSPLOWO2_02_FULL_67_26]
MRHVLGCFAFLAVSASAGASLDRISNADAVGGLKQALSDGSLAAVAKLGVENGYFGNPQVRIPLPPSLKRAEKAMRAFGMRKQADELVLTMNRAAEAAAPEARQLLLDAVKKMSVQDAKKILTGGDTAGTEYFKRATQAQLTQRFLPIVKKATDRVGLAQQYNALAGQGAALGLVKENQATIERYVTQKALDGLYFMIGEQEKAFRRNPVGASSDIVRKVFGALR